MDSEISAVAEAAKEAAKTASAAIEASSKLGTFFARILGEPIESSVGILADRLRFLRWERQIRLYDRWKEIIEHRGLTDTRPVPPKLALPIIENACLEENNTLQDLWAQLLASASDPNRSHTVRAAFIDIIKQLEPTDAVLLNFVYFYYRDAISVKAKLYTSNLPTSVTSPANCPILHVYIQGSSKLEARNYEIAADNLYRLRCLTPYAGPEEISLEDKIWRENAFHIHRSFHQVCISPLGIALIEACMPI